MNEAEGWGDADEDAEVRVIRSVLDPTVWVAVPYGMSVDQSFAHHPGGLRAVQAWAGREYAEHGQTVTWRRLNRDTYLMEVTTS